MALTEEEILVVQEKKKGLERPTFFNAQTRRTEQIGEDLEAFAILVEPDLREEVVDRLGESNEGDPLRQALYQEALFAEEKDAVTRLVDAERAIAGFGSFRDRVLQSPGGTATEVAPMVQDVQRNIGPVVERRERAYHEAQAARTLIQLNDRLEGNEDQVAQRESWEGVLSAYRDSLL